MSPRITAVRHVTGFVLELTFSDGVRRQLDFRRRVAGRGGVFAALQDESVFRQVRVDPEIGTIVWPNGVDFCPDVLYSEATGTPVPAPRSQPALRP